jgi:hypothetical protein
VTTQHGVAFNRTGDNSLTGVQGQYVTIEGDVKVTAAPDDPPEVKYAAGVANLNSRDPERARELIWDAMMGWKATGNRGMTSEVLFHWLTAMLSGRTVQQFTEAEISRLRHFRSWCPKTAVDEWAQGVQLVYQLLDWVLRSNEGQDGPKTRMSPLISQFDRLGDKQRELLRPLDLFLSSPRKDEMWRAELERARAGQQSVDRLTRAWMFFHPDPARVVLYEPQPDRDTAADRWRMRASMVLFAALTAYVGLELLMQGAVLGLLGYVAGLTGGIVAAAGDLELRPRAEPRQPPPPAVHPDDGHAQDLNKRIGKLFDKYFEKYEPVEASRKLWRDATVDVRRFCQDEVVAICLANGYSADQVAWLVRHEVCQMNQRWRDGLSQFPQQQQVVRSGSAPARRAGLAMLVLGFAVAVLTVRGHLLGFAVVLLSAVWAWRCWLRVSLKRAASGAPGQRQEEIDEAYRRWRMRLEDRPKDAQMAEWLEDDRTVLLGMALDRFRLSRSRLVAHGFLEKPAPFARRSQITGGMPRYQKYQIWMFLLADDGVHQLRASLDFLTGTPVDREDYTYSYDAITVVHTQRKPGGVRAYEIRLAAGAPIKVRVRETDARPVTQNDQDEDTDTVEENESATEELAPDVASVTNTLSLLQGVVREGRNWLRDHNWTNAWADSQPE